MLRDYFFSLALASFWKIKLAIIDCTLRSNGNTFVTAMHIPKAYYALDICERQCQWTGN